MAHTVSLRRGTHISTVELAPLANITSLHAAGTHALNRSSQLTTLSAAVRTAFAAAFGAAVTCDAEPPV